MRANVDVGATSRGVGAVEVERAGDVGGDAGGGEETRGGTGARGVGGGAVEKTAREGGGDVGVGGVGWRDVEVGGRELSAEDGVVVGGEGVVVVVVVAVGGVVADVDEVGGVRVEGIGRRREEIVLG